MVTYAWKFLVGAVAVAVGFGLGGMLSAALALPGAAFFEILALLAAIAATTIAFWPRSRAAGILMLPYLGWVAFASVLNFTIWRLNY